MWEGDVPAGLARWGRQCGRNVLDWLLPPSCLSCGCEIAPGSAGVCGACFNALRFVHPPFCDVCALPLTQDEVAERGWLCETCEIRPPLWRKGRSAFLYEGQARQLIMGLKYGSKTEHAATLARFMTTAGADILKPDTVLVPVPVHRWRLWTRGYNQAALISRVIARKQGLAHCPNGLKRQFRTEALAHLSRHGRHHQLAGAMTVNPRHSEFLQGRSVILVDDILTTGATLGSCAKALLEIGCVSVDILVAARVTLL
ncbi:ComF family protein [Bombella saccharophila]|uniref:ComF family protein n=1 Tax=Bombella saccharophila TaxID=2967338 RepID=A0ABT3W958_9PROT|nr:ComF family protein [Bombella saccharophila]MCX5614279.1 ComF family protein [Bombella saccharophila]